MGTVLLRNINPLGHVDLPLVGRQEGDDRATLGTEGVGCLEPGEVFEVDADLAGQAPSTHLIDVVDEEGEPTGATVEVHDPGHGLLAQVGNYELVTEEI